MSQSSYTILSGFTIGQEIQPLWGKSNAMSESVLATWLRTFTRTTYFTCVRRKPPPEFNWPRYRWNRPKFLRLNPHGFLPGEGPRDEWCKLWKEHLDWKAPRVMYLQAIIRDNAFHWNISKRIESILTSWRQSHRQKSCQAISLYPASLMRSLTFCSGRINRVFAYILSSVRRVVALYSVI